MARSTRWSVRNVTPEALEKLLEVQRNSPGWTMGELISDAIFHWYVGLSGIESDPPNETQPNGMIQVLGFCAESDSPQNQSRTSHP